MLSAVECTDGPTARALRVRRAGGGRLAARGWRLAGGQDDGPGGAGEARAGWVLQVAYRAGGGRRRGAAARLPLGNEAVARRVEALLDAAAAGNRAAAHELAACLHAAWARSMAAGGRESGWEAALRYLATLADGRRTANGGRQELEATE